MSQSLIHKVLHGSNGFLVRNSHCVGWDNFRVGKEWIDKRSAQSVFDQQLLQFERGLRSDEVLLTSGSFTLRANYLNWGKRTDFNLFFVVGESFLRQSQRALFYLHVFVGVHQVPVNILDLVDRCDDLQLECNVGNLAIVLGDSDETGIW